MITDFKYKNYKSTMKFKKDKALTTKLKSFDTIVFFATTSSSIMLSLTGIGLIAIPKTAATACVISIGNKIIYEIVMQKYIKYKKQYEKDQQTIKTFNKLYRKSSQDIIIHKKEYESLCIIFTKNLNETKNECFLST